LVTDILAFYLRPLPALDTDSCCFGKSNSGKSSKGRGGSGFKGRNSDDLEGVDYDEHVDEYEEEGPSKHCETTAGA